jgi:hypothetical protein
MALKTPIKTAVVCKKQWYFHPLFASTNVILMCTGTTQGGFDSAQVFALVH